jgi:hypothetical protein
MAKKKNMDDMTGDATAAFLRSQGIDPLEFAEAPGLDKYTLAEISDIAKRASAGDPEARKIAEALVQQGRLESTSTPAGRQFKVVSDTPMPAVGAKPEVGKPVTPVEQMEAQKALERSTAKKRMDAAPIEPIEPVARPAQEAQKQKLVQAAKEEKSRQASAEAAAEFEKPAPAAKIEGGELRQTGSEADRLAALKKRNFKAEWGKLPEPAKRKILVDDFGERALQLNKATQQKLGEMAVARQAFKQSALTAIPDMDDAANSVFQLANRIENSTDLKGIENAASITHQRLLTGQSGKIRGNLLTFRKPRAGEIGSAKIGETEVARPKPESGVEERSPGFDKAKVAEVPADAKNSRGKLSVDDVGAPAPAAAPEAPVEAPAAAAAAAEVAAEATAAATPAEAAAMAERTAKYKAATEADPKKYGVGSGLKASKSWTKEQSAARKELRKQLEYPDKFVPRSRRAAAPAAAAAAAPAAAEAPAAAPKTKRITMTDAEKKSWGAAVRADKTKYGTSTKKATEAQKAARNDLAAKIIAGRKAAPAAATVPAATAAAAAAAPAATAAVPAATVPAAAPAAAEAAAPAAAAAGTAAKGAGRLAGVMRFLGPLAAVYGGYELLSALKGGTVDEADERRIQAIRALGAVGGGMDQDMAMKEQVRGMQRMVDLAAIQRQQALDQMRNQYTGNQALDALVRGQQASLAALAQPSRPSIAEMMARM